MSIPNLEVVAPVAPEATAPVVAPVVAPEGTPPVAPEAPVTTGTPENPVVVPFGTEAKFKELADGGWKQEDVDAYLSGITDEALRAQIKDGIDGKLHLADGDPPEDVTSNPFSSEELAAMDPVMASRVSFLQEQLIAQMDATDKARGELPEQMQRLLQDPMVKARLDSVYRGDSFVPQMLHEEAIMGIAKSFVDSNDAAGLQDLLKTVMEAIPEVILQQRAQLLQESEERDRVSQENSRTVNYLTAGLQKLEAKPEFQSTKPAVIETANGPALNPEHPGGAFALWLEDAMKNDGMTLQLIERMGGLENLAYSWLAKQKGGFGQVVKGAVDKSTETLREKLMRSRNASLRQSAAPTLNVASSGVARALMHGVDIDKALADNSYAGIAMRGLTQSQQSELAKEMRKRAGMV